MGNRVKYAPQDGVSGTHNDIFASGTQCGIALTKRGTDQFLYSILYILIRQCAFSILHNYPYSKAFWFSATPFPR